MTSNHTDGHFDTLSDAYKSAKQQSENFDYRFVGKLNYQGIGKSQG